jgi:fibronectin type 3 domain-containing protein
MRSGPAVKLWLLLFAGLALVCSAIAFVFVRNTEKSEKPHKVTLNWQPATASSGKPVASYNVYRGTVSGGPYSKLVSGVKQTKYEDNLVNSGTTYYYVVTSVDEDGHESQYSSEIQAKVP